MSRVSLRSKKTNTMFLNLSRNSVFFRTEVKHGYCGEGMSCLTQLDVWLELEGTTSRLCSTDDLGRAWYGVVTLYDVKSIVWVLDVRLLLVHATIVPLDSPVPITEATPSTTAYLSTIFSTLGSLSSPVSLRFVTLLCILLFESFDPNLHYVFHSIFVNPAIF